MSYSKHFETLRHLSIALLIGLLFWREGSRLRARQHNKPFRVEPWDWLLRGLVALAAFQTFIASLFAVTSGSMAPTLPPGTVVLAVRGWLAGPPKAGEVILYDHEGKSVLKRILALPGEKVEFKEGRALVDGVSRREGLPRDYISATTLAVGQYFVLGDNLAGSADSRVFGPIPQSRIWGTAKLVLWPFSRFQFL